MNICYIYQDQYPWEIRIDKIVGSLADHGMKMHVVSKNTDGKAVKEWVSENICIHRLPRGGGKFTRWLINFPAFFSPFWLAKILLTVRKHQARLIIVRDLPLAPAALLVSRLAGVPVMIDMAEDYPALIQSTWDYRGPRLFDYLLRNPFLLRKLENWLLPRLDAVLVVSEASQRRVEKILKSERRPIWIVRNSPRLEWSEKLYAHPLVDRLKAYPGLIVLYTGMIEAHRGLDVLIKATPLCRKEGIDLLTVIVGSGRSEQRLRSLANDLNVSQNILLSYLNIANQPRLAQVLYQADECSSSRNKLA